MLAFIFTLAFFTFVKTLCPAGTFQPGFSNSSICYSFERAPMSYKDAANACQSSFPGYKTALLTSISDAFLNSFLSAKADSFFLDASDTFWVGGQNYGKIWAWDDNSSFSYTNWDNKVPTQGYCLAVSKKSDLWYADDCSKVKAFVCEISMTNMDQSSTTVTTTTSRPSTTPFTLNPGCVASGLNIYVNYFIDGGQASAERFEFYRDIIIATSGKAATVGFPTQNIALYMANGEGDHSNLTQLNDQNNLTSALINTVIAPSQLDETVKLINDLNFYQSILPTQLNYHATPVAVLFLANQVEDLDSSKAKIQELQAFNPQTHFIGVFLSTEPTISQLPFEYTLNITYASSTTAQDTVDTIFEFICSVTPANFHRKHEK